VAEKKDKHYLIYLYIIHNAKEKSIFVLWKTQQLSAEADRLPKIPR
jgi:hypothetical protein